MMSAYRPTDIAIKRMADGIAEEADGVIIQVIHEDGDEIHVSIDARNVNVDGLICAAASILCLVEERTRNLDLSADGERARRRNRALMALAVLEDAGGAA